MNLKYIGKTLLIENTNFEKSSMSQKEKIERVLVIGDLHLGYEASLRSGGLMIPIDLYKQVMEDFEDIFDRLDVELKGKELDKIILLGDLKHEFGFIMREEWDYIGKTLVWLKKKCKELVVIEGNHDKILKPILRNVKVKGDDYYIWNEIAFMHGDKSFEEVEIKDVKTWIIGHGHPAISLEDVSKKEKYKCFLIGNYRVKSKGIGNKKTVIIAPSFFPLIEGTDPREHNMKFGWDFDLMKFEVKIIGDDLEVLDFGKLSEI